MYLREKVLDEFHSDESYRAAGHGLNVNDSTIYVR